MAKAGKKIAEIQGKNCHCNDNVAKLVSKKSPTRKMHIERKKRIPAKKMAVDKLKIRCRNS